jgi:hypothetical protein
MDRRPHDDLDDGRTVMDRARAKAAATWTDEPEPVARRRPTTSYPRPSGNHVAAFIVAAVFALIFAVSYFGRGSTPVRTPYAAPTAAPAAGEVAPDPESAPALSAPQEPAQRVATPAPLPTGWIVGSEPAPAPAQLAPAAPAVVEAPVVEHPAGVYSELVPLEPTPVDVMSCARRGIGPCRGERP